MVIGSTSPEGALYLMSLKDAGWCGYSGPRILRDAVAPLGANPWRPLPQHRDGGALSVPRLGSSSMVIGSAVLPD
ncbi:hypothetical protein ACFFX0_08530 [Citricoccus parietis]|uniref:Uncharacterized protein n=1 Tax=Citricoccus parietis TaxID=592307 RepID=A0ABV5FX22_9MICC